jgi:hypothetical protein
LPTAIRFNGGAGHVGQYNAATGATISGNFIPTLGGGGHALALDAHNHVFVSSAGNSTVGQYDATTGALINANIINSQGPAHRLAGLALDRYNHLFVVNGGSVNTVGEYDATTGATINPSFVTIPSTSEPLRIAVDDRVGRGHRPFGRRAGGPRDDGDSPHHDRAGAEQE